MFNNNNIMAIEIGSKYIKIINGRKSKNRVSIVNYGMCDTPDLSYSNGNIHNREEIARALKSMLENNDYKTKNTALGIEGQDAIIRHLVMPQVPDKQLKIAAMMEMQRYIPIDQNEYVIECKKVGKIEGDKDNIDVLLVAVPKKKINDYMYIIEKLGLKIKTIGLFSDSMTKFLNNASNDVELPEGAVALLNIGYISSTLVLAEEGKLFLEKEIEIGTRDIEMLVQKAFQEDAQDEEILPDEIIRMNTGKKVYSGHDSRIYKANANTRYIIDSLVYNMVKIFDFYSSSGTNKKIGCILIYGEGALIQGVDTYIKSLLNIDTRMFEQSFLKHVEGIDEGFKENIYQYLNCISLLL